MNKYNSNSRRKFMGTLAAGATVGLSMISEPLQARFDPALFERNNTTSLNGTAVDEALKRVGKKAHPVGYDVSQANWWGFIWSNVYYMTNADTGTPEDRLGVVNVLRHHGILFSFNDETIAKYKLGELFSFNDPQTNAPALKNPFYIPAEGVMPLPGLVGLKGLQDKGALFCVCNMAYKVYSGVVAEKMGLNSEDVYNDFVKGKLSGIELAPSGVWALGRLAENNIAYIDASVG